MSLAILFHLGAQHVSDIKYIHLQELATVLMNYHIGRLVLSSLCVGACVCRLSLQNEHHQIPAATKAPTHNELRTRRPMW